MIQSDPAPSADKSDSEALALSTAVAAAEADRRRTPHEDVRTWLLRLANGYVEALPPNPR